MQWYEWNIKSVNKCSFCGICCENITHLFVECPVVEPLWSYWKECCDKNNIKIQLSVKSIITSHLHEQNEHINFVCTFIKQLIYRYKCAGLRITVQAMETELCKIHDLECAIAKREHKYVGYCK